MERLDKLLCSTGRWSRREVKQLVRQSRVLVDGRPADSPEEKLDPERAELQVDGQRVYCAAFLYLMLHKPAGVLSATEDRRQPTVLDLLPPELGRRGLFPVGGWTRIPPACCSSPMTALCPTPCSPPAATWTRCIGLGWRGPWTPGTRTP